MLANNCGRAPSYVSNRQLHEDLEVPYLAEQIRIIYRCFKWDIQLIYLGFNYFKYFSLQTVSHRESSHTAAKRIQIEAGLFGHILGGNMQKQNIRAQCFIYYHLHFTFPTLFPFVSSERVKDKTH